jgi:hypothetical protein
MDSHLPIIQAKGIMTRAYGYIYTIFDLEASHTSLSKNLPGPDGRAQTRGSPMRTPACPSDVSTRPPPPHEARGDNMFTTTPLANNPSYVAMTALRSRSRWGLASVLAILLWYSS